MITVESENAIIEAAIEISCQQGEEANGLSTTTLTLNARFDIVSNQFRTDMRTFFFYPEMVQMIPLICGWVNSSLELLMTKKKEKVSR